MIMMECVLCQVGTEAILASQMNFIFQRATLIEVRECLLPLSAEPFVFQFAIQKFKDQNI